MAWRVFRVAVFLDEPSSGMDPVSYVPFRFTASASACAASTNTFVVCFALFRFSRRSMWDLISSTMKGRSVILTTHSMEECEALCSRIGIMVNGRLTCLGGAQHLKSRFGADYLIDVSIHDPADRQRMTEFILSTFPGSTVFESHGSSVKYKVLKHQPPAGQAAAAPVVMVVDAATAASAVAPPATPASPASPASPPGSQKLSFAQIFRFVPLTITHPHHSALANSCSTVPFLIAE